jgi:hypothetical protein
METKCGRFAEWLGHDDMARVGFENCREYRDAMIDEGDLSSGSILNHVKLLKALFTYAFDGERFPVIPSGLPQRCTPALLLAAGGVFGGLGLLV